MHQTVHTHLEHTSFIQTGVAGKTKQFSKYSGEKESTEKFREKN